MVFETALCANASAPYSLSVTTASLVVILCFITVPGNLLICWAIMKDPNKELKTSFNCLVFNLAIADLITGTITEPMFAVFHFTEAMDYVIMNLIQICHVAYFMSCTASVLSIGALAIERYLTVTSPHRRGCSRSRAITISIAIWILAIAVSCLYFVTTFYLFLFLFVNTTIFTTFAIIIFAYVRIYKRLHARAVQAQQSYDDRITENSLRYERKATRTFTLILFFFVCCNLSSFVIVYVIGLCDVCSCDAIHWLRDCQFLMALINCAVNQFLYAWRMPTFTRVFKDAIPSRVRILTQGRVRPGQPSSGIEKSTGITTHSEKDTSR